MKVLETGLPGVLIVEPTVHGDDRGFFLESWSRDTFNEVVGRDVAFVQDNHSRSAKNVLRGIHYQVGEAQSKLVRVVSGAILDVAVDFRRSSPHFGEWIAIELSEENHRQLWVPGGFGHGFVVLSESADLVYKVDAPYAPLGDRAVRWNDPDLGINWGISEPRLSAKDLAAPMFSEAELYD